jgi:hypothetical protein
VVLKGGTVVPLKGPVVRRGNTAYLTRPDGTLLSVPVSEIDRDATAAANRAAAVPPPAPAAPQPSTPAEVARVTKDTPKARVKITDADVSHPLDLDDPSATAAEKKDAAAAGGAPRVEVADYTQELKGETVLVRGSLRNVGQAPAENLRMTITAIDDKGQGVEGTTASLSKGVLEPGHTVEFSATLNVGQKAVASLRFAPQWTVPKPPAPAPSPAAAPASADAKANKPPAPKPTPPADGKTGYIPGASHPDNQPKPPNR